MKERNYSVWLGTFALMSALTVSIQCARSNGDDQVVATVAGHEITLSQVDQRWGELDPGSRMQARQQMYDGRTGTLDQMIAEKVIELAAHAKGVTPDQLLQTEIPKRVHAVTEDEIAAAYREAADQTRGTTLEQVRPRIREYLQEQRYGAALHALVDELRKASNQIEISLDPPRLQVNSTSSDPVRGPATAPVTIVEFSDFQCPFCKQARPTLKKIQAAFGDRVRLIHRNAPLPNHPDAMPAAEAGQCAHDQGKFWEYHDVLFDNQQALERPRLKEYAVKAGLDSETFTTCLEEGMFRRNVEQDVIDAQAYGVSSTPTFFINGRILMGAVPYETLEKVIREELARNDSLVARGETAARR
jgi:protein-disulfide isomerase